MMSAKQLRNRAWKLYEDVQEMSKDFEKQQAEIKKIEESIRESHARTAAIIAEMEALERAESDKKRWKAQEKQTEAKE
jgi:DNA anti-recombination protein RmuC